VYLKFQISGVKKNKISTEEVRIEIRKIEESLYGESMDYIKMIKLNDILNHKINIPFNLMIKAELISGSIKLVGYTDDSKAVLDPNCGINHISKIR
jgi:hypothetical protein